MATDEHTEFDPRFDPAFQRGFDAAPPGARPAPTRAAPRSFERTAPPVPAPVTIAPSYSTQATQPPAAAASAVESPESTPGPRVSPEPDAQGEPEDWRRRNPFVVAVAVISVALIAGGVWGVQVAREPFLQTNAAANTDYVGLQMLVLFAPLSIVLGLASAIGILFFYAFAWQRSR